MTEVKPDTPKLERIKSKHDPKWPSAVERFWNYVVFEPTSGCWLWIGFLNDTGYGSLRVDGRTTKAHRFSYELHKGPIPAGLLMDHKCRLRCCVNPDHLEPVTDRENVLRGISPAAKHAKKTHCMRGHEFTTENTMKHSGRRECRICSRQNQYRLYHRLPKED